MAYVMPTAIPTPKGLVVYCQGCATAPQSDQHNFTMVQHTLHPTLDKLAKQGCGGQIMLRHVKENDNIQELVQMCGFYDDVFNSDGVRKTPPNEISLQKKYGGLKAALLSENDTMLSAASNMEFHKVTKFTAETRLSQSVNDILFTSAADQKVDLAWVHFAAKARPDVPHIVTRVDELLSQLEPHHASLYIIVLMSYAPNQQAPQELIHELLSPEVAYLRPTQSYQVKDGQRVQNVDETRPVFAIYHHPGTVRRDFCTKFDEVEIAKNGGNLKVLADHFLAEVAFKLGTTPKYGS